MLTQGFLCGDMDTCTCTLMRLRIHRQKKKKIHTAGQVGDCFLDSTRNFLNLTFYPCWESTPYSSHIPQGEQKPLCVCVCACVCVVMSEAINSSIHLVMIPWENKGHYSSDHSRITFLRYLHQISSENLRGSRPQLRNKKRVHIFPPHIYLPP